MSLRHAIETALTGHWFPASAGAGAPPSPRLPLALLGLLEPLSRRISALSRSRIVRLAPTTRPTVIVVGNLVAGGAGKTPASLEIARILGRHGLRVGLLANAYRAADRSARLVGPDDDAALAGDEAVLLARASRLPVACGRMRDEALRALLAAHPGLDVVIADDGLQHHRLARSLEIALFDGRGAGNGRLLPAGPLRQPLEDARRMDAVLLNGTDRSPIAHAHSFRFDVDVVALVALSQYRDAAASEASLARTLPRLQAIRAERRIAIAGIAAPSRFADSLRGIGLECRLMPLGDHAPVSPQAIRALDADLIVMTEKDAVKLPRLDDARCWVAIARARMPAQFEDWLLAQPMFAAPGTAVRPTPDAAASGPTESH